MRTAPIAAEPEAGSAQAARALCASLCATLAAAVCGQAHAGDEPTSTVTAFAIGQGPVAIDSGGRFSWQEAGVAGEVSRKLGSSVSLGIQAGYVAQRWSWDLPSAFGPVAPWTQIHRPSLGMNLGFEVAKGLNLFVAPQLEWSYESGAQRSDALAYGAVFGAVKVFSPTLVLGLGVAGFRQIDRNRFFPFFIVNWQINDDLRLGNALQAGPWGGAGLEVVYAPSDDWELAAGGAYRDNMFRLRSDGPNANGLGQNSGVPVFARLSRKFDSAVRIDLYAGVVLGGRLKLLDAGGATLQSSGFGAAPLLALSATLEF